MGSFGRPGVGTPALALGASAKSQEGQDDHDDDHKADDVDDVVHMTASEWVEQPARLAGHFASHRLLPYPSRVQCSVRWHTQALQQPG